MLGSDSEPNHDAGEVLSADHPTHDIIGDLRYHDYSWEDIGAELDELVEAVESAVSDDDVFDVVPDGNQLLDFVHDHRLDGHSWSEIVDLLREARQSVSEAVE